MITCLALSLKIWYELTILTCGLTTFMSPVFLEFFLIGRESEFNRNYENYVSFCNCANILNCKVVAGIKNITIECSNVYSSVIFTGTG